MEADSDSAPATAACALNHPPQNRLVAQMDTVKVAKRHDTRGRKGLQRFDPPSHTHAATLHHIRAGANTAAGVARPRHMAPRHVGAGRYAT
jgi:hypothetical protein